MSLIKNLVWCILVMGSFFMMGCASTQLVESWQEPSFEDKPLGKVLVLGVFKDDKDRRLYEDGAVKALVKGKASGIAGYSIMPKVEDYDEKEEIMAAVAKVDADAVMIATLVGFKQKENYRPPQVAYVPSMGTGHGLYDYYALSYDRLYDHGHTVMETTVTLEITVFSAKTGQMVWAGSTKSVNPDSNAALVNDVSGLIVGDMKHAELL